MNDVATVTLGSLEITLYSLLAALLCLLCAAAVALLWKKTGRRAGEAAVYALLCALCGLLLGRLIFCAVRFEEMFYDEMGDYIGLSPFFFLDTGSVNVVGAVTGCLLAAWLNGKITGAPADQMLDVAAVPGLLLFAALRLIEPLSGEGYGPLVESPALCWPPLAIDSGWGDWSLSVCFVEGVLAVIAAAAVLLMRPQKTGTRALQALTLLSAAQILPEILRQDNVLLVLIFAPVSQIGFALLLLFALLFAQRRQRKMGLRGKAAAREIALLLLGAALLVGGEFALDKTDWSRALLYGGMIAVLALMAWVVLRRIQLGDQ